MGHRRMAKNAKVSLIGASDNLKWTENNGKITIDIPHSLSKQNLVNYAWVFKIFQ
jgi:Alpha-L-fucosidase C-terminal domain